MKKKVILPFEDHPYSLTYHYIAFPMGIIQGNAKKDITPDFSPIEEIANGFFFPLFFERNPVL